MREQIRATSGALVWSCVLLTACGPYEKQKAQFAEQKRVHCLDNFCEGDFVPKHDTLNEFAFKLNGQWFIGPREYGAYGGAFGFDWWEHKPLSKSMKRPPEVQALAAAGKGYDFSIEIFLRSSNIPPAPHGYKLIELAEEKGWIAGRKVLRPGLEAITMKHVIGPNGQYIDHVTYYAATGIKGGDGLPPVSTCAHDHPDGSGGTGFMWQPGIWAGTRMNQRHCADWPEIYQEMIRILQLIRKGPAQV